MYRVADQTNSACLISIVRIVFLGTTSFEDFTYGLGSFAIWGAVEVNRATICACLTIPKPLVVKVFPRLLRSSYNMSTPGGVGRYWAADGRDWRGRVPRLGRPGQAGERVFREDGERPLQRLGGA